MGISRKSLYLLILLFCAAGYSWLMMHLDDRLLGWVGPVCLFKKATGLPCPSCGATRSMLAFLHGNFLQGFLWNPLGFFLLLALIIFPFWLVYDLVLGKNSFHGFYATIERNIIQKKMAWPLVFLILINWCWNIYKGV